MTHREILCRLLSLGIDARTIKRFKLDSPIMDEQERSDIIGYVVRRNRMLKQRR